MNYDLNHSILFMSECNFFSFALKWISIQLTLDITAIAQMFLVHYFFLLICLFSMIWYHIWIDNLIIHHLTIETWKYVRSFIFLIISNFAIWNENLHSLYYLSLSLYTPDIWWRKVIPGNYRRSGLWHFAEDSTGL